MSFLTMKRVTANVFNVTSICYPHIQNGVHNDFLHGLDSETGAGNTCVITKTKLNSEDELDMDEEDGCSRSTTDPGKTPVKPLVFANRLSQSTNEDGSLPSSPDTPSGCGKIPDFPASPNGKFEKETRELIEMFYRIHTEGSRSTRTSIKALSTMKRVVENLIEKHQFAYNGMILKLSLDQQEDSMNFVSCVAKNLFCDGTTNWGRIASLLAFGAVVCKHLKDSGREHCVPVVAQEISSYLLTDQRDWLLNNKAWEGFVEFFHVEDPESVVRNALMAFAGVAGIGAGLAYLIR
ncbi:hypothetical protein SKAU_G00221890 [Synaphobranchus kaupii]|uniref:Bcl-2 Bcl-2 homology region 1-3 domain-containing protein n=1 Tax=Synaphobranchus kaupii TaxID=118154 RepID=A0A9Q1FB68_SYNKA|nr:hypothetical protein SKAU_G00221890 [Synaphobranchus kaupii]